MTEHSHNVIVVSLHLLKCVIKDLNQGSITRRRINKHGMLYMEYGSSAERCGVLRDIIWCIAVELETGEFSVLTRTTMTLESLWHTRRDMQRRLLSQTFLE